MGKVSFAKHKLITLFGIAKGVCQDDDFLLFSSSLILAASS